MPPAVADVFTVFVRVLLVCDSLPSNTYDAISQATISMLELGCSGNTHAALNQCFAFAVMVSVFHQLDCSQLFTLASPSHTSVHVPIALLLDRVGKVKLVATKHGRLALLRR